jgi:lipoprotein-releasing system permease protein
VILVAVAASLITLLATIYPSWQASRIDPAVALRYE